MLDECLEDLELTGVELLALDSAFPACAKPRLPKPCAAGRRFGEGRRNPNLEWQFTLAEKLGFNVERFQKVAG